jgi:DnaJ domain
MKNKALYATLGVDAGASKEDIKHARKRKAKETHPDTPTGSHAAFQEVERAYKVLSNPASRAHYDATGAAEEFSLDSVAQQARAHIAAVIRSMLGAPFDLCGTDLPQEIVAHLERARRGALSCMEAHKKVVERALAAQKRLHVKEGVNTLAAVLQYAADESAALVEREAAHIASLERAIDIVRSHTFDTDAVAAVKNGVFTSSRRP